jgi:methionyl-tRNA formyltransferase
VTVQIHAAEIAEVADWLDRPPGTVVVESGDVLVACGEGTLRLVTVQFAGKSAIPARAAVAGGQLTTGQRFASAPPDREPLVSRLTSGSATTA